MILSSVKLSFRLRLLIFPHKYISGATLARLNSTVESLKEEKQIRLEKIDNKEYHHFIAARLKSVTQPKLHVAFPPNDARRPPNE
ncbi:hypothetical protein C5167_034426 [Papaver somniferum]|uniref:Uncharacterized protein n=1 Tax=Papaver somniferum TaxID=3469 RepID=A0A4Y7KED4_PAPSO|nr:hypothetical protein C5167_034426 [Papaver somniferum]